MSASSFALELRLRDGMDSLGLNASGRQVEQLIAYAELMLKWNKVYNLTAIRQPLDVIDLHLIDCLALHAWWQRRIERRADPHWLDVGSGAGLPAIVLAIMQPASRITSVDAVDKKIAFQRQAKATLGLDNFSSLHHRIETLHSEALVAPVDLITSRAFSNLALFVSSTEHLLPREQGRWVAMKGKVPSEEIADLQRQRSTPLDIHTEPIQVPHLAAERCVVILDRSKAGTI